jgi:4-amino-4-deoxy-L-arabinose transferase-like glycosyltransferase
MNTFISFLQEIALFIYSYKYIFVISMIIGIVISLIYNKNARWIKKIFSLILFTTVFFLVLVLLYEYFAYYLLIQLILFTFFAIQLVKHCYGEEKMNKKIKIFLTGT